jgi:ribonuclease BN (tRNA processing enzyme)
MAYLPDHEPALGVIDFPRSPEWTSGHEVAEGVDLLIHDAQFSPHEYPNKQGWGHSTAEQAMVFGALCEVREFVSFHYDPGHDDAEIDRLIREAEAAIRPGFRVTAGMEGATFTVG